MVVGNAGGLLEPAGAGRFAATVGRWVTGLAGRRARLAAAVAILATFAACGPQSSPRVRVGLPAPRPMGYLDADGRPAGFIVESLSAAAVRAGVTIDWAPAADAATHDEALRRGEIDIVAGSSSGNRRGEFWVSTPFWSSELTVLVRADSGLTADEHLRGHAIALPTAAGDDLRRYFEMGTIVPVDSAPAAADAVCAGRADAGVVATMFLRELLRGRTKACESVGLAAFDSAALVDYVLVARRASAGTAARLRDALDEITLDGTLADIAARHPPVSAPHAAGMAALLKARYDRRLLAIALAAGLLLVLLGAFHVGVLARSKRQLRQVNARLQDDIGRREAAEREREVAERERETLQAELLQAQKMESIGRLAGGIAHDFNNILTVQKGYCELLQLDLPPTHPIAAGLAEIDACANRAAALTRQLLAFSRRQALQPRVFDLNALVDRLTTMLGRLIGEDVVLEWHAAPQPAMVKADPGQVEQVITNLAVNARDAMPRGGRLVMRVALLGEDALADRPLDLPAGPHVRLTISDTGGGMDDATRRRLFEPFFTTKPVGAGTGLGLATAYGIVRQSGGAIAVDTELGKGTTFSVFLPQVAESAPEPQPAATDVRRGQGQLVLIVEDEPALRRLTTAAVERLGYRARAEVGGEAALRAVDDEGVRPDVLLTDVVMPDVNGPALAREIRRRMPALPVIYMSGYTQQGLLEDQAGDPGSDFVQKPFTVSELGERLANMLAR